MPQFGSSGSLLVGEQVGSAKGLRPELDPRPHAASAALAAAAAPAQSGEPLQRSRRPVAEARAEVGGERCGVPGR